MKVAVIGTWHVHTKEYTQALIDNANVSEVFVWDKDAEKGKVFAQDYNISFIKNYDDILNNKDIDSVAICTATSEHPEIIKQAAKAGKHIFTEKVLAFTEKDAIEISDEIEQFGGKFTIAYFQLNLAKINCLRELIAKGIFGDITYMRVRNVHAGASNGWLPAHFFDKETCGGGAMMDLGAHPMYLLNHFMGEPVSITSIFTKITGKEVEDNAVCTIEFKNGAIGVSESGFVSSNDPFMLELSGLEGCAIIMDNEVSYRTNSTDNKWVKVEDLPDELPRPIHYWIDAVVNDTQAPYGLKEAIGLSKLMEGAYISYETGKKHTY